jgi:hypothetical protein
MATQPVNMGTSIGVIAEDHLAGAQAFSRNSGASLETDAEIRSSASGAGAANNFVTLAQGDRRSSSSGQHLSTLGYYSESGIKLNLRHRDVVVIAGNWIVSSMVTGGKISP